MNYAEIGNLCVEIVKNALPLGVCFYLTETVVNLFLRFAFPKSFRGGI